MGSFNVTCSATHQNINPRDRCRIAFVARAIGDDIKLKTGKTVSSIRDQTNGCERFWELASVFLPATYYDYGLFEVDESVLSNEVLNGILGLMLEVKDAQIDDFPSTVAEIKKLDLDKRWEAIQRYSQEGKLLFKDKFNFNEGRPFNIAIMVLHEEAALGLEEIAAEEKRWVAGSFQRIGDPAAIVKKIFEDAKSKPEEFAEVLLHQAYDITKISATVGLLIDSYGLAGVLSIAAGIRQLSEEAAIEEFTTFASTWWILIALSVIHLPISAIVYTGQDYGNEYGKKYKDLVNRVEKSIEIAYYEENGEQMDNFQ